MLETIKQRLQEIAADGYITCAAAWDLAEEFGVSKADMGRAADAAGIKIKDCQLGCF